MKDIVCTLDKLKKGKQGEILEINIKDKKKKKHLLEMGLTIGTIVKVKKIAPSGDPISIELRDYELCISKKELENIMVIICNTANCSCAYFTK